MMISRKTIQIEVAVEQTETETEDTESLQYTYIDGRSFNSR